MEEQPQDTGAGDPKTQNVTDDMAAWTVALVLTRLQQRCSGLSRTSADVGSAAFPYIDLAGSRSAGWQSVIMNKGVDPVDRGKRHPLEPRRVS